jgi:hypothetical protein
MGLEVFPTIPPIATPTHRLSATFWPPPWEIGTSCSLYPHLPTHWSLRHFTITSSLATHLSGQWTDTCRATAMLTFHIPLNILFFHHPHPDLMYFLFVVSIPSIPWIQLMTVTILNDGYQYRTHFHNESAHVNVESIKKTLVMEEEIHQGVWITCFLQNAVSASFRRKTSNFQGGLGSASLDTLVLLVVLQSMLLVLVIPALLSVIQKSTTSLKIDLGHL